MTREKGANVNKVLLIRAPLTISSDFLIAFALSGIFPIPFYALANKTAAKCIREQHPRAARFSFLFTSWFEGSQQKSRISCADDVEMILARSLRAFSKC